jgi:hypothetical protein
MTLPPALAPVTGAARLLALSAMRSLFGTLKPPGAVHQPGRAADRPQNPAAARPAAG